jgi:hypothetical protein
MSEWFRRFFKWDDDDGYGQARIPEWAESAGMPTPREGEGFDDYCARLGLEPKQFVRKNERFRNLANMRLAAYLTRKFPSYFEKHMERKRKARNLGS